MEGTIEPTERPEEAIFKGPRREVSPPDIGAKIMEGLGIRRPRTEPGQAYRRVPERVEPSKYGPEALEFERAKVGIKAGAGERERATKALETLRTKTAEEGLSLRTDPTLEPQERLKAALQLYAERPREEKEPTWQQQQTDAAIRTGLSRGIGLVAKGPFGELEQMPIKSYADALTFLQYSKRDPAQFKKELQFYKDIIQVGITDDGRTFAKMGDGRIIDLTTREEIPPETLIER